MANRKKKKKKAGGPKLSPKQYIKTKARVLPIHECLINADWSTSGIANVILARKHKGGNITWASYLVDILCLGVKETFYAFSEPEAEYEHMKRAAGKFTLRYVDCEYALAHNIIYGAIEFAGRYGFRSHPEFSVTQYMLEQDHDAIPKMEIEFGEQGKPCLVTMEDEPSAPIIAQLEKTAGRGGYKVIYLGAEEEDDFDDFDDENNPLNWDEEDWRQFESGEKELSPEQMFEVVDRLYDLMVKQNRGSEPSTPRNVELKEYKISFETSDHPNWAALSEEEKNQLEELRELAFSKSAKKAIKPLQKLIEQNPHDPIYYNYLTLAYEASGQHRKARHLVEYAYQRFPDYLFARCNYALYLLRKNKLNKIPEVFDHTFELQSLYPDRNEFHISEVLSFFSIMCRYFTAIDDVETADVYADLLQSLAGVEDPLKDQAIAELKMKKLEKVLETEAEHA